MSLVFHPNSLEVHHSRPHHPRNTPLVLLCFSLPYILFLLYIIRIVSYGVFGIDNILCTALQCTVSYCTVVLPRILFGWGGGRLEGIRVLFFYLPAHPLQALVGNLKQGSSIFLSGR